MSFLELKGSDLIFGLPPGALNRTWFQRPDSLRNSKARFPGWRGGCRAGVELRGACLVLDASRWLSSSWIWAEQAASHRELQLGYNSRKMRNPAEESCFNSVFCLIINCTCTGDSSASWLTALLSSLWLYFLRIFCISSQINRNVSVGLYVHVFVLVISGLWHEILRVTLASWHQFHATEMRTAMDGCCQLFKETLWLCNEFWASSSKGHTQVWAGCCIYIPLKAFKL